MDDVVDVDVDEEVVLEVVVDDDVVEEVVVEDELVVEEEVVEEEVVVNEKFDFCKIANKCSAILSVFGYNYFNSSRRTPVLDCSTKDGNAIPDWFLMNRLS